MEQLFIGPITSYFVATVVLGGLLLIGYAFEAGAEWVSKVPLMQAIGRTVAKVFRGGLQAVKTLFALLMMLYGIIFVLSMFGIRIGE